VQSPGGWQLAGSSPELKDNVLVPALLPVAAVAATSDVQKAPRPTTGKTQPRASARSFVIACGRRVARGWPMSQVYAASRRELTAAEDGD
jgi:hypothetical protein